MLLLRNGYFSEDTLAKASRINLPLPPKTCSDETGASDTVLELGADTDIEELSTLPLNLSDFAAVEIVFLSFADGRGFTLAQSIRDKLGFKGELRARGHIIPDQQTYLSEVGFDAALLDEALVERHTKEAWQNAAPRVGLRYQQHTTKNERQRA